MHDYPNRPNRGDAAMPADTDQPTLAVTQADRDMAAPYMGFAFRRVLNGECDDSGLVQQFARHRTNSEPRPAGDLREALEDMVDLYDSDEGCRSLPQVVAALATHSPAPMAGEGALILRALRIRMATACDWTRAGKDHVKVRTADWHALMEIGERAKDYLAAHPSTQGV